MSTDVQTLKGFRDFLPEKMVVRQRVIKTLQSVFELYGYSPLETPALEYESILMGKYGEEGDKLMYRFEDNGKRRVALRYDQTVPLARVVAQYQNELPMPFKRYQMQPVWRAENTQKGRYREFLQVDADIVGTSSILADAEVIKVVIDVLNKLGFKKSKVLINDRNVFLELDDKDGTFIRAIDKIKKIGREKVIDELVEKGMSGEIASTMLQTIENAPQTPYITRLFKELNFLGVDKGAYTFEPTLARGLDYYTGLIFEVEIDGYDTGSVCGGGRYDKLIGMFAGREIPAVGFAFGFDRLLDAMETGGIVPETSQNSVLVTIFSPQLKERSIQVARELRENNISVEIYLDEDAKIEKQLKYADKKGISYVIVIGPDEARNNTVTLKNLSLRTQETLPIKGIIIALSS